MSLPRDEWLRIRKTGLGASDAAPVAGISPFRSALEVYLEKTGQLPAQLETPAMRWGLKLEETIAAAYTEETGLSLEPGEFTRHADYQWMIATPDRIGPDRLVELKTANAFAAGEWGDPGTDQIPEHYLLQVQHQMEVYECGRADVAVLIGGSDFRIYTVARNDALIRRLVEIEAEFWDRVLSNRPPDPSWAHPSTPALIAAMYPITDESIELDLDALELTRQYEEAKAAEAEAEGQKHRAKSELLLLMREAGVGLLPDGRQWRRKQMTVREHTVKQSTRLDFRLLAAKRKAARA